MCFVVNVGILYAKEFMFEGVVTMLKRVMQLLVIMICTLTTLLFTSCGIFEANTEPEIITELNQTYEGLLLNITATEIRYAQVVMFHYDELTVSVNFIVENVSNEETFFDARLINVYIDDVAASPTIALRVGATLGTSIKLAPGKRTQGYHSVTAPNDAKTVELHIRTDWGDADTVVIFSLDIPPIEVLEFVIPEW